MKSKMAIAIAAALIAAIAAASPAEAAKKKKKKWRNSASAPQSIVVHPSTRRPPPTTGTGAVVRGHLPGPHSSVPFGYGYGRFDADFNAYTQSGYRPDGSDRRRPWQY